MKVTRRFFLAGVSALAIAAYSRGAEAWTHGSASTPFPTGWQNLPLGDGGYVTGGDVPLSGINGAICRADTAGPFAYDGSSWSSLFNVENLNTTKYANSSGCYEARVAPSNPNRIYFLATNLVDPNDILTQIFNHQILYITNDRGLTTTPTTLEFLLTNFIFNGNDPPNGSLYKLAQGKIIVDPHDPDVIYVGLPTGAVLTGAYSGAAGVMRSLDGGVTWSQVAGIPIPVSIPGFTGMSIDFSSTTTTLSGHTVSSIINIPCIGNGVYQSTDGGNSFTKVTADATPDTTVQCTTAAANEIIVVQVYCYGENVPLAGAAAVTNSGGDPSGSLTWHSRFGGTGGNDGSTSSTWGTLYEYWALAPLAGTYNISVHYADGCTAYQKTLGGTATGCWTTTSPGDELNVGTLASGSVGVGMEVIGTGFPAGQQSAAGIGSGIYIASNVSGSGSGSVWKLNAKVNGSTTHNLALTFNNRVANEVVAFAVSHANTTDPFDTGTILFTGFIDDGSTSPTPSGVAGNILTITAITRGSPTRGAPLYAPAGSGILDNVFVVTQLTGTLSSTGKYQLSKGGMVCAAGTVFTNGPSVPFVHSFSANVSNFTTRGANRLVLGCGLSSAKSADQNFTFLTAGSVEFFAEISSAPVAAGTYAVAGPCSFTGYIDDGTGGGSPSGIAGNVLTVSAIASGSLGVNRKVTGTGITTCHITSQSTGTTGSTGTYVVDGAAQNTTSAAGRSCVVDFQGGGTGGPISSTNNCLGMYLTDALVDDGSGLIALDAPSVAYGNSQPSGGLQPINIQVGVFDASGTYWCIDGRLKIPCGIWRNIRGSATWDRIDGNNASGTFAFGQIPAGVPGSGLAADPSTAGRLIFNPGNPMRGYIITNGNAAMGSITFTGSNAGNQAAMVPNVIFNVGKPWLSYTAFDQGVAAMSQSQFDPVDGKIIYFHGKGVFRINTDINLTNSVNFKFNGLNICQGLEQSIVQDVCTPVGAPYPIVGEQDQQCVLTDLPRYPFAQVGPTDVDAHCWGMSFAPDNPQFVATWNLQSTNGLNRSGYSINFGAAGSWTIFPTFAATASSFGGCIACASTGNGVSNDGLSPTNATAAIFVIPSGSSTTPKYTLNNGTTWLTPTFNGPPTATFPKVLLDTGNGFALAEKLIDRDWVNLGTYYFYMPGLTADAFTGIWRSTDYGANFSQVKAINLSGGQGGAAASYTLLAAPSAGHIFLGGNIRAEGPLYYSTDGGPNLTAIPGVSNCKYFCLGAKKPGNGYTCAIAAAWGTITQQAAAIAAGYPAYVAKFGMFRGDCLGSDPSAGFGWTFLGDLSSLPRAKTLGSSTSEFTNIWGDWNVYGRWYAGRSGNGAIMFNPPP